ncbi:unnamed protein product [Rotaria sp. Silwood2]|nr:unnamed protein product [Rotaria sp. Silwood2]
MNKPKPNLLPQPGSAHGAAACLGPEAITVWKNSGAQWEAVSSRIVTVRIECRLVPITIIAVYAPINPSNGVKNDIETCDEFYKTLQATIDKTHKSDMIMIMGDFNARVGVEQANTAGGTVGKHAIDKQNQNGRRLVDFCLFNSFIVTNTFFPHKTVRQGTRMHPKTKQWHMLDYILVNRKFRSSVQDVRVHRGATGGIGTDHHLLRAKILLQQIPGPTVDNEELSRQNAVPTLDEVVKAIGQNKNKKAPGKDDLPAELLKAGGLYVAEWLHEIIRDVWEQEVAALAETKIPDSGVCVVNGYTFIYSGSPSELLSKSAYGAAVCLGPEATNAWKNSGAQWEAVSSRLVTVRIECRPVPITIIAVYAPINPSNGVKNDIETCDEFYKILQATIDKTHKSDMIMIMGDFNARVGVEQANTAGGTVGKHAIDKQNQNGRRLVDFCLFNSFIVTNTFFPHKAVHQGTWMHPKTKQWHMLDYILVNRKFRSSVQDVRAHRGATGGIGTDHHLLRAKIRLHLKCRRKAEKKYRLRLDQSKLADDCLLSAFQIELANEIKAIRRDNKTLSVNEKFTNFVNSVRERGRHYFGNNKSIHKGGKEWFTPELKEIVDKKAKAYVDWQLHRSTTNENKYRNRYRTLAKIVQNKVYARQHEYWEELSIDIENAVKVHDPTSAFQIIRRLRGNGQSIKHIPVQDKNGLTLTNSKDQLNRWKEYFDKMLNVDTTINEQVLQQIPSPTVDDDELSRQDAVPTLDEVVKAIGQIKNKKAPGKDDVPAELLKAGGHYIAEWLHEIIRDVWEQEVMEDLPNLKCFSLTCFDVTDEYDYQILPLLRRLQYLEELTLYLWINDRHTFIDGNHLYNEILIKMAQLERLTFYISSYTYIDGLVRCLSNDDIKLTFTDIGYEKVACIIDYMYDDKALCHVFSLPFEFDCLERIGNNFPTIVFSNVTYLWVCDTIPFEYEFFIRVAQFFPHLRKFHVMNALSPSLNHTDFQRDTNNSYSIVEYPHLTSLTIIYVHIDYVEQFLLHTKISLPRLTELKVKYEKLKIVTENFTRDATRLNCLQVKRIIFEETIVHLKEFYLYFPLL